MTQAINPAPPADAPADRAVQLGDLAGVWKRTLLVEADGTRDETSIVYWLQLGSLCGDIRLPASGSGAGAMAFAGCLTERDGVFRWTPELATGIPANADPDEGRLRWEGGILREDGARRPYLEHWECAARPSADDYALRFHSDPLCLDGYLIRIADFAFYACQPEDGSPPCFALIRERDEGWVIEEAISSKLKPGDPFVWPDIAHSIAGAAGTAGCKFDKGSVVTFERMPARKEASR